MFTTTYENLALGAVLGNEVDSSIRAIARMLDMTIVIEIIGEAAHELLQVMKQNAIQHKAIDFVKGSSVPAVTEQRTLIEFMRKFCTTVGLTDALGKYSAGSQTNVHRGHEPLVI